jgi:TPR repeat protein
VFAALLFLAGMWTGILIVRETGPLPYEKTAGPERTIRQAAEKGNPRAQAILGAMYYDGEGVARDYRQALNWYRKAAEQGFAEAQYNLGFMYYMGKGVERDRVEARRWFHSAAEQGDAKALDALRGMEGGR